MARLETLGVREHVHVREHVCRVLLAARLRDLSQLFDRWIFIARLVTGWAGQAIIGALALGQAVVQRIAGRQRLRLLGQVVGRLSGFQAGLTSWLEDDGFELLAHIL